MDTVAVKFPPELRARLAEEARRRNVTQSAVIREAVEAAIGAQKKTRERSCADLARDLIGSVHSGRRNLATDKSLLEAAVVDDFRGRKRRR